jgi:hypothetical protein
MQRVCCVASSSGDEWASSPGDADVDGVTPPTRDRVALILALGTAISFVLIAAGSVLVALQDRPLSENATQLLVAAFGGMIGVLGSYLGFRAGLARRQEQEREEETDSEPDD